MNKMIIYKQWFDRELRAQIKEQFCFYFEYKNYCSENMATFFQLIVRLQYKILSPTEK